MLNDSEEESGQQPGGGGGTGGGADPMGGGGYIQVTPQEKEAIERVSVVLCSLIFLVAARVNIFIVLGPHLQ